MYKCGTFRRSKHTSQSDQLLYETDRVYLSSREAFKYIRCSQHRDEHLVEWEHIHSKNVFTRCSTVYVCRSVVAQSGGNLKGGKFNDLLLSSKKLNSQTKILLSQTNILLSQVKILSDLGTNLAVFALKSRKFELGGENCLSQ